MAKAQIFVLPTGATVVYRSKFVLNGKVTTVDHEFPIETDPKVVASRVNVPLQAVIPDRPGLKKPKEK